VSRRRPRCRAATWPSEGSGGRASSPGVKSPHTTEVADCSLPLRIFVEQASSSRLLKNRLIQRFCCDEGTDCAAQGESMRAHRRRGSR
jgi:hypothetical protein